MDANTKLMMEERNSRMQGLSLAVSGYGLAAIRGIFILNGSAAIAVLTKQPVFTPVGKWIILLCAVGALFAVLCSGASFLAQWYSKESFLNISSQSVFSYRKAGVAEIFAPVEELAQGKMWFWIAAGFYSVSVGCFVFSSFFVFYYF